MAETNNLILIIGGGIAGMSIASNLANLGLGSVIVEKDTALGGHLKNHYSLFPHDQKASELLDEYLTKIQKDNIEIYTGSQVSSISGERGAFQVTVITKTEDGKESTKILDVGAVVIATGFAGMDTDTIYEYSYSLHKNIITGLEFEQMLNDSKKADKNFGRPSDGGAPQSAAIIMCTGSRDEKHNLSCCEVGCRAGLNHAFQLKKLFGDSINVTICYIDIRATGKDNEDFYRQVREMDVHLIKSRPSEISKLDEHHARFNVFDLVTHKLLQIESDLIILETALEPHPEQAALNDMMKLEVDDTGFLACPNYYRPHESATKGVFFAGTATGPRDLPGTIANAAMVAAEIAYIFRR
jgi:heterodisulfide reductase subunit A